MVFKEEELAQEPSKRETEEKAFEVFEKEKEQLNALLKEIKSKNWSKKLKDLISFYDEAAKTKKFINKKLVSEEIVALIEQKKKEVAGMTKPPEGYISYREYPGEKVYPLLSEYANMIGDVIRDNSEDNMSKGLHGKLGELIGAYVDKETEEKISRAER